MSWAEKMTYYVGVSRSGSLLALEVVPLSALGPADRDRALHLASCLDDQREGGWDTGHLTIKDSPEFKKGFVHRANDGNEENNPTFSSDGTIYAGDVIGPAVLNPRGGTE